MIPLETLRSIRTVVTHDACPDGIASALIVVDALPDVRVVFARYGSAELAALQPEPGMLFVDFSPPADRAQAFVDAGAICLDHHKTARDVVALFGDRGVFGDEATEPGVCGAVLAFREVWEPLWRSLAPTTSMRFDRWRGFAEAAGIRDTWQRQHPCWTVACAQAEALRFWGFERLRGCGWDSLQDAMRIGPVLLERKADAVKRSIADARWSIVGDKYALLRSAPRKWLAIIPHTDTSDVADALGEQADIVAGFAYRCEPGPGEPYQHPVLEDARARLAKQMRMTVSLRSRGDVDVAAIAKAYGGGGHTQAAGYTVDVDDTDENPYEEIERAIDEALRP